MTITTPGLLFPAISLLLLAYTNRFVVLSGVIRSLAGSDSEAYREIRLRQIHSLRARLQLIRTMQQIGVASFATCTLSMLALLLDWQRAGMILFAAALVLLLISLMVSLAELQASTRAINIELEKFDLQG